MQLSRRNFLIGAPAVVAAASLMPVSAKIIGLDPGVGDMTSITQYVPQAGPEWQLTMDDFSKRILGPQVDVLAEKVAEDIMSKGSNLLSINQITREAVELFKNSNTFIKDMDEQYAKEFAFYESDKANGYQWERHVEGDTLRIRLPNDWRAALKYNKERRTITELVNEAVEQTGVNPVALGIREDILKIAAPVALAAAAVAVVEKNPVVSRRFWGGRK